MASETPNASVKNDRTADAVRQGQAVPIATVGSASDEDSFHSITSLSQSAVMVCSSPLFSSAHSTTASSVMGGLSSSDEEAFLRLRERSNLEESDTSTRPQRSTHASAAVQSRDGAAPETDETFVDCNDSAGSLTVQSDDQNKIGENKKERRSADNDSLSSPWKVISEEATETFHRPSVNMVTFNQDKTCVCIATNKGYRVRTVPDAFERSMGERGATSSPPGGADSSSNRQHVMVHESVVLGGVSYCQMIHNTSLVAIVKVVSPRCVSLVNAKTGESLRDLFFIAAVRRVDMNRKCIAVLSADGRLHVFNVETLDLVKSVSILHSTEPLRLLSVPNASSAGAFFDLSKEDEESWLACRSSQGVGSVQIFDGKDMRFINNVKAHDHSITRIAIGGRRGEQRLATASEQGTVIRIFSLPQCQKLQTLWRGSNPCNIYSIAFSDTGKKAAVSGSTGTIHIFDLLGTNSNIQQEKSMAKRFFDLAVQGQRGLSYFFPDSMTDKTDSLRSYAKVKLKPETARDGGGFVTHTPTTIAIVESNSEQHCLIVVCTDNAMVFRFRVDVSGTVQPVTAEDMLFDD